MLVSAKLSETNQRFEGQTMDSIIAAKSKGISPVPDPLDVLFDFLIDDSTSPDDLFIVDFWHEHRSA